MADRRIHTMTKLNPAIINVTDELSRNAQSILGDRLRRIILYGSYARGDYKDYSDLDIMVLADINEGELKDLENRLGIISSRASLEHDITVSLLLYDESLFTSRLHISPFYRNVLSEGVEIYATR
jgi:predicted nucleotidyltransferase